MCEIKGRLTAYLIGSIIRDDGFADDLDIILIYDKRDVSIQNAIKLRKLLKKIALDEYQTEFDICLLSTEESRESDMVENVKRIEFNV